MNKYDLRYRAYEFSVELVKFLRKISISNISYEIFRQVIRSGTSIGANIEEADSSPSRKDFKYKMTIAKKEAAETLYWLKIIIDAGIFSNKENIVKVKEMLKESDQLLRIISSIIRKIKI